MKPPHKLTRRDAAALSAALCCAAPLLSGCDERAPQEAAFTVESETQFYVYANPFDKVDVLWVINNASSMCEAQAALRPTLADFVTEFVLLGGHDLHVAVVTTDMLDPAQAGRFQNTPSASCPLDIDLSQCPDAERGEPLPLVIKSTDLRYRRLDGAPDVEKLTRDLGCNAAVGTDGAGVEMGLEAARAALDEPLRAGHNGGFLRDDAYLAIFFVSNKNDCSGGGSDDRACAWSSEALVPVQEYVDFFTALKQGDAFRVIMGGVIAPDNGLRGEPSCAADGIEGYAGYRYEQLIDAFPNSGKTNICDPPFDAVDDDLISFTLPAYTLCLPRPSTCEGDGEGEHDACGPFEVRVELERADFVWDIPNRECDAVPHSTRRRCVLVEGEDYLLSEGEGACPSGSAIVQNRSLWFDDKLIIRYRAGANRGEGEGGRGQ